ncbi:MAG: hypothetical protein ACHQU0_02335 [Candidatus Paceibacteria bacterium]
MDANQTVVQVPEHERLDFSSRVVTKNLPPAATKEQMDYLEKNPVILQAGLAFIFDIAQFEISTEHPFPAYLSGALPGK